MDELKRKSREKQKGPADRERSKPPDSSPRPVSSKPSAPAPAGAPADRELFRQHCVKCHGADGTGSKVRRRRPEIPDFTDPEWQARRSDAQVLASILDGKGKEMPPWREKINEEQARRLVAYVRAFDSSTGGSGQGEPEEPPQAEPAEAKPPGSFSEKLIGWFG
jgi:mono/diheme cytochrome c family protein